MRTGPPPAPRLRLNPAFRQAVRAAMTNGYRSWMLAQLAGFPHQALFSSQLHAKRVKATPLTVERFQEVADTVGFAGPLFLADEEAR